MIRRLGSISGLLVPVLYFRTQVVAFPFYDGYDWVRQAASELGSSSSCVPAVFNFGAILIGVVAFFAAM